MYTNHKDNFDEILANKLGASLENKQNAIWQKIQEKQQPKTSKKILFAPKFFRNAAVLGAGILLGVSANQFLFKNDINENISQIKVETVESSASKDTVFVVKTLVEPAVNNETEDKTQNATIKYQHKQKPVKNVDAIAKKNKIQADDMISNKLLNNELPIPNEENEKQIASNIANSKQKVIHLNRFKNSTTDITIQHIAKTQKRENRISKIIGKAQNDIEEKVSIKATFKSLINE